MIFLLDLQERSFNDALFALISLADTISFQTLNPANKNNILRSIIEKKIIAEEFSIKPLYTKYKKMIH
jgi:hypothetical protein